MMEPFLGTGYRALSIQNLPSLTIRRTSLKQVDSAMARSRSYRGSSVREDARLLCNNVEDMRDDEGVLPKVRYLGAREIFLRLDI
jgi:hypothetical protein